MRKGKIRDREQYEAIARLYLKGFGWKFAITTILGDYNSYKLKKLLRNREFMGIMMKELRPVFDEMEMDEKWALKYFKENLEKADPKSFLALFQCYMQARGHMNETGKWLHGSSPVDKKQLSGGQKQLPQGDVTDAKFSELPQVTQEFIDSRQRHKEELQDA